MLIVDHSTVITKKIFPLQITRVGVDFAAKYTKLQDTVSAQLSLIQLNLNRATVAALIDFAIKLLPAIKR